MYEVSGRVGTVCETLPGALPLRSTDWWPPAASQSRSETRSTLSPPTVQGPSVCPAVWTVNGVGGGTAGVSKPPDSRPVVSLSVAASSARCTAAEAEAEAAAEAEAEAGAVAQSRRTAADRVAAGDTEEGMGRRGVRIRAFRFVRRLAAGPCARTLSECAVRAERRQEDPAGLGPAPQGQEPMPGGHQGA